MQVYVDISTRGGKEIVGIMEEDEANELQSEFYHRLAGDRAPRSNGCLEVQQPNVFREETTRVLIDWEEVATMGIRIPVRFDKSAIAP
jgi:hypothetical protein